VREHTGQVVGVDAQDDDRAAELDPAEEPLETFEACEARRGTHGANNDAVDGVIWCRYCCMLFGSFVSLIVVLFSFHRWLGSLSCC